MNKGRDFFPALCCSWQQPTRRPQKHFAGGIIPVLLCETAPIFLWRYPFVHRREAIRIGSTKTSGGNDHA